MEDRTHARQIPVSVVAGLSALIVAAGGGAAWWAWQNQSPDLATRVPNATTSTEFTTKPSGSQTTAVPQAQGAQVYWLKDTGTGLSLVSSPIQSSTTDNPTALLEQSLAQLLAGPSNADTAIATTIPAETQLRSVKVAADGVHVDLSEEFTEGGGSTSMTGRVAQVLYTATSLDPNAKVWLSVEGEPLEVLGGEGLLLEQPVTRQSFEKDFDL